MKSRLAEKSNAIFRLHTLPITAPRALNFPRAALRAASGVILLEPAPQAACRTRMDTDLQASTSK